MQNKIDERAALLAALQDIALAAGVEVMKVYEGDIDVARKADASPQTVADLNAEAVILARLDAAFPDIPVIAEESVAADGATRDPGRRFFLVDPLDGTKEFVNRNGEFTVNIALIEDGDPVAGVVLAPALDRLFSGARGRGATVIEAASERRLAARPIQARPRPQDGLTVVASRSHRSPELDDYLADIPVASLKPAGSSLKFCVVASGEADLYPRLGPTMEWDTAAGHAVLTAAGGRVVGIDGSPLTYGKPEFRNPFFIAEGAPPAS